MRGTVQLDTPQPRIFPARWAAASVSDHRLERGAGEVAVEEVEVEPVDAEPAEAGVEVRGERGGVEPVGTDAG